jgi:hypothetical protein
MMKPILSVVAALVVATPVFAQIRDVDVPTSPDDPLSKSVGWVESPARRGTAAGSAAAAPEAAGSAAGPQSRQHLRSSRPRRARDRDASTQDTGANQLNRQELGGLPLGVSAPAQR